uniref:Uncharacterized protein n=1 Tax=Panagrolaimus sp. ES5 TaxID=591445 RepID=A0AC34GUZ4_9BILA
MAFLPRLFPPKLAISLIFSVVLIALFPAFGILGFFRSLLILTPTVWTFISFITYSIKFITFMSLGIVAILVYADIAFPWVMRKFSEIFMRLRLEEDEL